MGQKRHYYMFWEGEIETEQRGVSVMVGRLLLLLHVGKHASLKNVLFFLFYFVQAAPHFRPSASPPSLPLSLGQTGRVCMCDVASRSRRDSFAERVPLQQRLTAVHAAANNQQYRAVHPKKKKTSA